MPRFFGRRSRFSAKKKSPKKKSPKKTPRKRASKSYMQRTYDEFENPHEDYDESKIF